MPPHEQPPQDEMIQKYWQAISGLLLGCVLTGFASQLAHIQNEVTRTEVKAEIETHDFTQWREWRADIRSDMREIVKEEIDSLKMCEAVKRAKKYPRLADVIRSNKKHGR